MANVFKDAAQSFYSGTFYGELARTRKGIGVGMIVLLTLLVSLLMCSGLLLDTRLHRAISQFPQVAAGLPKVTLNEAHKLSIDKPVPYRIDIGDKTKSIWVVIDTNYKLSDGTAQYMRQNNILALIDADETVLARTERGELEVYDFKESQPFTIAHDQWVRLGAAVAQWGVPVLAAAFFISYSIGMFILNMAATLLTAMVMMAMDVLTRVKLEFPSAMRLAAAARIPVNVLPIVPVLFGVPGLAAGSGWVLWGLYVVFAVCAVRIHSSRLPR